MIGLSLVKRWAVLALFALIGVAGLSFIPAHSALAANGTISGGPYTVDVKGTKVELQNDNTTVTLSPTVPGLKPNIVDGKITIPNVPEGTYTVTVAFRFDQKMCDKNWATKLLSFASPAFLAFCKFTGVGTTYYSYQQVFANVVVRGGQTTTLNPANGNLGNALQTDANGNPILDCSGKGIITSFVICPMIENVLGIIDWVVENFIQPYLAINPLTTTTNGQPSELYQIWNNIRNLANIVFILAFFVIIFSQATSIGISNYGIKRLLPRLILIGIATNVSFFICALMVDIFNVLGIGIASLLVAGVTGGSLSFSPGNFDLFALLAVGGLITPFAPLVVASTAAIIFGVFVFLFIGAIILFIAAIVILLRQIVIIFLVLASPLAFVAGLLPNTQRWLNQWFTAFAKLLAMYPILMALFAAGKIAATVLQKTGPVTGGAAPDLTITIMSFMAFVLPLVMVPFAFKFAGGGLHRLYSSMQNGLQKAQKQGTNLAVKGAKNSRYGQAAQQFLNNRKQIGALKGRETLRGALNRNPQLAALMGGLGGGKYASRYLDTENRKFRAEEIGELGKGFTLPMANAISRRESLTDALRNDQWLDGKRLTDEDRVGIQKMQSQGYLSADGRLARGTPQAVIAANAALEAVYRADDVTAEKISTIGSYLQGAGAEANAEFSTRNRDLALQNKSKNMAYAQFNDGLIDQWANKKPQGVLDSGIQGLNRDALKYSNTDIQDSGPNAVNPNGENALLYALRQEAVRPDGSRDLAAVLKRTRQTLDQDHREVIEGLSYSLGFTTFNPASKPKAAYTDADKAALAAGIAEFEKLRSSLRSSNVPVPPEFAPLVGTGGPSGTPPSPPPPPSP